MNIKTWQERISSGYGSGSRNREEAMQAEIDELRAALKAQPVQEPVAYMVQFSPGARWVELTKEEFDSDIDGALVHKKQAFYAAPVQPVQPALISDLSMMVRRLVLSIRRLAEDDTKDLTFANACLDWLKEKGLAGSPLREGPLGAQPVTEIEVRQIDYADEMSKSEATYEKRISRLSERNERDIGMYKMGWWDRAWKSAPAIEAQPVQEPEDFMHTTVCNAVGIFNTRIFAIDAAVEVQSLLRNALVKYADSKLVTAQPVQPERQPWAIYLVDRADGVAGRYAIARWHPSGYREVWNLRKHVWTAFSDDVLTRQEAETLLKAIVIPTTQPVQPAPLTDSDIYIEDGNKYAEALKHIDAQIHAVGDAAHELFIAKVNMETDQKHLKGSRVLKNRSVYIANIQRVIKNLNAALRTGGAG